MAIRIRQVNGHFVALCAAETDAVPEDVYLNDALHYALALKFAREHDLNGACSQDKARADSQKIRDARRTLEDWLDRA